jgi:hypothetical protein
VAFTGRIRHSSSRLRLARRTALSHRQRCEIDRTTRGELSSRRNSRSAIMSPGTRRLGAPAGRSSRCTPRMLITKGIRTTRARMSPNMKSRATRRTTSPCTRARRYEELRAERPVGETARIRVLAQGQAARAYDRIPWNDLSCQRLRTSIAGSAELTPLIVRHCHDTEGARSGMK